MAPVLLIVLLGVSIVGMATLLALKRFELSTGVVLGGRVRPALGAWVHRGVTWVEYALPAYAVDTLRRAGHWVRALLHRLAALFVVLAERLLESTLRLLRHKTQVPRDDVQASAFLREVSAHKKQLLRRARRRNIVND